MVKIDSSDRTGGVKEEEGTGKKTNGRFGLSVSGYDPRVERCGQSHPRQVRHEQIGRCAVDGVEHSHGEADEREHGEDDDERSRWTRKVEESRRAAEVEGELCAIYSQRNSDAPRLISFPPLSTPTTAPAPC
jgi:hypothetical protein